MALATVPKYRKLTKNIHEARKTRFISNSARCTSREKHATCTAILAGMALFGLPAGILADPIPSQRDLPLEWNITRSMWGSDPVLAPIFPLHPDVVPLRLVIVQHTVSNTCYDFEQCAFVLGALQRYFFSVLGYDLPYNFFVGNDDRVYEGRGWEGGEGAHTFGYNRCSLGLGFMGDYRREGGDARATALQLNRTLQLLESGVRDGLLHPQYVVVAASDLRTTTSPGDDLYDALRQWPHFNVDTERFRGRTCDDIYEELRALDDDPQIIDDEPQTNAGIPSTVAGTVLMLLLSILFTPFVSLITSYAGK